MEYFDKIYVAGHKGLVGSAIWNNLKSKGYTNLIGRSFEELDLGNQKATEEFFESERPDYVFLAAAHVGGIVANNIYRADFIFNNLQIQNNVIGSAYKYGVKKLLFLGSTCIYPASCPQPMKEDSLLTSELEYTNEPYAIAKIAGLKMCESFNIQYGTNFIAVMPTNLYGPNDNFNLEKSHVLPALIRKAHLGKALLKDNWDEIRKDLASYPIEGVGKDASKEAILEKLAKYGITKSDKGVNIEIWGTGKPMREFLWSEEMADACVFVMENVNFEDLKPKDAKEIRNCHINIGTGKEISIKDLAYLVAEKVGFDGDIVFNEDKPDGTMRKLTDPSKLHSLGWHHKIEIEEGIEKMYHWYLSK
ncbi:MAG: GDP-4-keto-6-deoxymannose-3,5-epimerase-4-reductase [Bacteroidetes bacterium]|nr:GDP-4-keto-6-deoxymannose-3,5-epimerase-4-reductase [Bacteroidota bacterium]